MKKLFNNMFYKWGIDFFDGQLKEYGGFNHFLAHTIFRSNFSYMGIAFHTYFQWSWHHELSHDYYDGYHNHMSVGFFTLFYGT